MKCVCACLSPFAEPRRSRTPPAQTPTCPARLASFDSALIKGAALDAASSVSLCATAAAASAVESAASRWAESFALRLIRREAPAARSGQCMNLVICNSLVLPVRTLTTTFHNQEVGSTARTKWRLTMWCGAVSGHIGRRMPFLRPSPVPQNSAGPSPICIGTRLLSPPSSNPI